MALGNPLNFISVRQWKIRAVEQLADIFPDSGQIYIIRPALGGGGGYEFAPAVPSAWRPDFAAVPLTYVPGEALEGLPGESPGTAAFNAEIAGKECMTGQMTLKNDAGQDVVHTLTIWVDTHYQSPDDTLFFSRQIAYVTHPGINLNHGGHVHADD